MNANEKVKIKIIYNTGSSTYEGNIITSYDIFREIRHELEDVSIDWISIIGTLNDVDNNAMEYFIRRDSICSIDCLKVNGM